VKSVKSLSAVALAKADAVKFLCLRLAALRILSLFAANGSSLFSVE
jgi:hypothetical protein